MTLQEIFEKDKATVDNLIGVDSCAKNRRRETVLGRVALSYMLHKKRRLSTTLAGDLMGVNHATILYHCKRAKDTLRFPKSDPELFKILSPLSTKRTASKRINKRNQTTT